MMTIGQDLHRGLTLLQLGRVEEAVENFRRHARSLISDHLAAEVHLGLLLQNLRLYREAEAAYGKAVNSAAHGPLARLARGILYYERGRYLEAEADYQRAIKRANDPEVRRMAEHNLAVLKRRQGTGGTSSGPTSATDHYRIPIPYDIRWIEGAPPEVTWTLDADVEVRVVDKVQDDRGCLFYIIPPLLGAAGIAWPLVVLVNRQLADLAWWQASIGALGIVLVALLLASRIRRSEPATGQPVDSMLLGWLATGTMIGAALATALAAPTDQPGLIPAAALLTFGAFLTAGRAGAGSPLSIRLVP